MSFSFNFDIQEGTDEIIQKDTIDSSLDDENVNIEEREAKIIDHNLISYETENILKSLNENSIAIENVEFKQSVNLKKLSKPSISLSNGQQQKEFLERETLNNMINANKSDLIPGVYEGGFKLWECAIDLVNYLIEKQIPLENKKVLEIGCGHGLPALYCLSKGSIVTFQDYNQEVIETLSIPNLKINQVKGESRFIAGDWKHVDTLLGDEKFDIILTSDTIYNLSSFKKLYNLIKNHLSSNGICLLAAKSFYFGVGGSVFQFKQMIEKENYLKLEQLERISDGSSNLREILGLHHP